MERKIYLQRYRLCVDPVGIPIIIRRSAGEATFQADEIKSGERVAVQVIPPAALRQTDQAELIAEADGAKKVQHLNIPAVRDFAFEGEQLVVATDYFEGTSARDWVKEKGPLPVSVVLRIASQMLSALNAATFQGTLHRAVTPENVLLVPGQTAEGEWPLIKVINFLGLEAKEKAFVSPEQRQGKMVDFRSQIYSLGGVLWFLLKGAPPPVDEEMIAQEAHGLPAPVRRLLLPMLAADAEARPLDPLVVEEQIQKCLAQIERRDAVAGKFGLAPATAEPAAPIIESYPKRRSNWAPIALAAVLAGAATIGALVFAQRMRWHEAVGIPIGVSNPPATSSVAEATPAAQINPSEPPVLTSTAVAEEENPPSEPEPVVAAVSNDSENEKPTEIPSSEASVPESTPATVVENAPPPEASAPAEAPFVAVEPSPTPVEVAIVTTAATPAPTAAAVDVQKDVTISQPVEEPLRATRVSKATKAVRKRPPAEMAPPANSALLPNERIYAAPLAPPNIREEPRRRPRPILRDSTRELPVLPALPPDD